MDISFTLCDPQVVLKVSDLSAERGERLLFSRLSFQASAGEIWHIRGQNGAGKTTLLHILSHLQRPSYGQVQWLSVPSRKKLISQPLFIGHRHGLLAGLTVEQTVNRMMVLAKHRQTFDVNDYLATWHLQSLATMPVEALSHGQQKRVALCKLFIQLTSVWILDEPWSGLDADNCQRLHQAMLQFQKQGGLIVLTAHEHMPSSDEHPWQQLDLNHYTHGRKEVDVAFV